MLLIDATHEGGSGRKNLINEDEDGLLGRQLDTLANNIDELSDCQVRGDQVLLLIDGSDIRLLNLLADDLSKPSLVTRRHRRTDEAAMKMAGLVSGRRHRRTSRNRREYVVHVAANKPSS